MNLTNSIRFENKRFFPKIEVILNIDSKENQDNWTIPIV